MAARSHTPSRTSGGGGPDGVKLGRLGPRHLALAMGAILLAWLILIVTGIGQEFPNDYAAFYAMARGLRIYGLGLDSRLYSVPVQYALESFIRNRAGATLAIPFVNPPIAAWVMLPYSLLPLRAAYLLWDATGLAAFAGGLVWLGRTGPRMERMGVLVLGLASSYPVYLALGQGQFDLLWPLAAALFVSSLGCPERLRYLPRAAVAALIVAIKPDLFVAFLVPLVAGWRRAPVRVVVATLLLLGAATAIILGPGGLGEVVHIELYTIARRFPPRQDITVVGFFYRLLGPGRATSVLGIAAIPIGVGALWWAWHRNPPRSRVDWWLALTAACCLSLLISPHDLVQGLLLLAAPALLVAKALRASGRSLLPLAGWIVAFDLVTLVDMSPHLYLPVRLTPILLLIAAISAWHLRGSLSAGAPPDRSSLLTATQGGT